MLLHSRSKSLKIRINNQYMRHMEMFEELQDSI